MAELTIAPCTRPKPECAPEVRKGIFNSFYVYCPRCKSSAGTGKSGQEAIRTWNYWRELDKPKVVVRRSRVRDTRGTANEGIEGPAS